MSTLSSLIMPAVLLLSGFLMLRRGGFEAFLRGGADGVKSTFQLIPVMVALSVALAMFNASGAAELIASAASPLYRRLGIPADVLPLAVTRAVSGSAASASFASLMERAGADSAAGLTASVLMGSSDTMIYVIAMYFSVTRVRSSPRAFAISALAAVMCLFVSSAVVRLFF